MNTVPIVVGVTPCCNAILRTSPVAISQAYHALTSGICPDCNTKLAEPIHKEDKPETRWAKTWFRANARLNPAGHWMWNTCDASVAYIEIHDRNR